MVEHAQLFGELGIQEPDALHHLVLRPEKLVEEVKKDRAAASLSQASFTAEMRAILPST